MMLFMNQQKAAEWLSIILGPHLWLPLIFFAFLFKTGLTYNQILILLPASFIFQIFIPLGYIFIALKLKKIDTWDLKKRQERYFFFAVYLSSLAILLILTLIFGSKLLVELNLMALVLLLIITVITFFWKISMHTSLATTGAILLNFLFNWQLLFLYLLIPVVAWSRYKLKRHTLAQLIAGILASMIVNLGFLKYFNLI